MRTAGRLLSAGLGAAALLGALPGLAAAADGAPIDSGDTAWLLDRTALVMVMLPGLALFYGGLVRRKNVLSTIMHSFFGLALVSVVWVLVGYSLAFGPTSTGIPGLIGGLDFVGVHERRPRRPSPIYGTTIPFVLFAAFQLMFAAITPALITGAFAERKRFGAFVLFTHPVVGARLLADRPLGLGGRRLAVQAGRARLRRRHRRPRLVRRLGADRRAADRPARRQRRPDGAPRHPDDRPRRGPAVVRLVRLQRRLRARGQRPRGERAARDEHRGRRRDDHLGPRELHPQAQGLASSARPAARSPASSRSPRRRAS